MMEKSFWNRKNKVEAVIIVGLLLLVSFGLVEGVTRTITDYGDYQNDSVYGCIRDSNGNYWDPSIDNLQTAIFLNNNSNTQVKITIPEYTFVLNDKSDCILLTNNTWLDGQGNGTKFVLADGANTTVFKNINYEGHDLPPYTRSNGGWGNHDIRLSNFLIDGNCMHEDVWWENHLEDDTNGIQFQQVNNSFIENIYIVNVTHNGILWWRGGNSVIDNVRVSHSGANFEGTYSETSSPVGIYLESVTNMIVTNCIVHDCYACGFVIEGRWRPTNTYTTDVFSKNVIVSNCIAFNCYHGFYSERSMNCKYSDCISFNNTKNEAYQTGSSFPTGVIVSSQCMNFSVDNCIVYKNGIDPYKGAGISMASTGIRASSSYPFRAGMVCSGTISNCLIYSNNGKGINAGGYNVSIIGNNVFNNTYTGIYYSGFNPTIINNRIINSGNKGITVGSPNVNGYKNRYGIISNNIVDNTSWRGSTTMGYGIDNSLWNMTIKDNTVAYADVYGIYNGASFVTINNNRVYQVQNNPADGIRNGNSASSKYSNVTISFNLVTACGGDGIQVYPGMHILLIGNNVKHCTAYGLVLHTSSINATVVANDFSDNTGGDISGNNADDNVGYNIL